MKRVIRVEKRKELLSLSLIYTNGEVRSFLSAQMSDDHVMSHTRVLSLKEGNTRAEKRGLDSGVYERERERKGGGKRRRREREGDIFSSRLSTWWEGGGRWKKGEKRRGRGRKRARTRRRRRPNGGSCGCCASSFPPRPDIDPSIADQYPKEKLRSRLRRRPGEEKISKPRLVTRDPLPREREMARPIFAFSPPKHPPLFLQGSSWYEALIVPRFVRFFCSEAVVGAIRVEGDSKGGIFYREIRQRSDRGF